MSYIDDIPTIARTFIDGLDRSALGSFTVDIHSLYLAHVAELYNAHVEDFKKDYDLDFEEYLHQAMKASAQAIGTLSYYVPEVDRPKVFDELYLWWERNDAYPEMLDNNLRHLLWDHGFNDSRERLVLIADSPNAFHDYFAVDIWDITFIEKCIADGVDASLAKSLSFQSGTVML